MDIIAQFDPRIVKNKIQKFDQHLLSLITDPKKELSLKSAAMEMILKLYPSKENAKIIAQILKWSNDRELKAVALQKWINLSEKNPTIRDLFRYRWVTDGPKSAKKHRKQILF